MKQLKTVEEVVEYIDKRLIEKQWYPSESQSVLLDLRFEITGEECDYEKLRKASGQTRSLS